MARSILVADDSATIRRVVDLTFSDQEIYVEGVSSGREALDRLPTLQPDIVLVDVRLPELGGYELCQLVKASEHAVPVLLLGGAFEPFDEKRARKCGADGHLLKPFESRDLREQVQRLLDRAEGSSETSAAAAEATPQQPMQGVEGRASLNPEQFEAVVEAVVERLSDRVREMARELLPELAARAAREPSVDPEREES